LPFEICMFLNDQSVRDDKRSDDFKLRAT